MTEVYNDGRAVVYNGDCVAVLSEMADNSVDAVVTDPPYGLNFMGKSWDSPSMLGQMATGDEQRGAYAYGGTHSRGYADNDNQKFQAWSTVWASECLRVLKPGGHLISFGGTRTWHRLAVAIEDAGFEMRDSLAWLYGSGFPKSHDVGKAIDKLAGAKRTDGAREWSGGQRSGGIMGENQGTQTRTIYTTPATPEAEQWDGWGTALKPAFEPIVLARKPLAEKTIAKNVLTHGTGAINIDASRVGTETRINPAAGNKPGGASLNMSVVGMPTDAPAKEASGRWPANVILDEHAADHLAEAARFFYCAKAPKSERPEVNGIKHPTVKPLTLMRWLLRLVTPPGGTVLDPFAGSGTTIEAALMEGFNPVGIEMDSEYVPLILARINKIVKE